VISKSAARSALLALAALTTLFCIGCKSASVAATVTNHTGGAVTLIEVDYPSASFGRDALADGASFPYRFAIIGSGPTKISWTDAARHNHTSAGPDLQQGQHGSLNIELTPTGATWTAHLTPQNP
jgi:hypothetical protein